MPKNDKDKRIKTACGNCGHKVPDPLGGYLDCPKCGINISGGGPDTGGPLYGGPAGPVGGGWV